MTVKKLIGQAPSQAPRNRDLGTMAYQDVSLVKGPAFSAYLNTTASFSGNTWSKAPVNTEQFDTSNCFDPSTNFRFTPNVAGYYQVNAMVRLSGGGGLQQCAIYKNGSIYCTGQLFNFTMGANAHQYVLSELVYMNGSTDYLELYGYSDGTPSFNYNSFGNPAAKFSACLLRAA